MNFHTPLRYPGGKRRLAPMVMRLLDYNGLKDIDYVEPYAGGGAVALSLLYQEYASTIHLNDLSRPVYAIWHTMLNNTEWLCKRIQRVKVTMREWRRRKAVFERQDTADLDELGFSAFFLNRTNRSGIIRGGVIGGKNQSGSWKMGVRFNKETLIDRIQKVARYRDRVKIYQMDGKDFTEKVTKNLTRSAFTFYDPPYIERSERLYFNKYELKDHCALAASVATVDHPWIVTYDTAAIKHDLYLDFRRIVYGIHYTAHEKREDYEVMFVSHDLEIPNAVDLLGERMRLVKSRSRFRA